MNKANAACFTIMAQQLAARRYLAAHPGLPSCRSAFEKTVPKSAHHPPVIPSARSSARRCVDIVKIVLTDAR